MPTLYTIGSADPLVPLRGGEVRSPWLHRYIRKPPVTDTLECWAAALGCEVSPHLESDRDGVRVEVYPGRRGPTRMALRSVTVDGLGHHWPGGLGRLNEKLGGPPSSRLDATTEIYRFFQAHSLT
jgi:polyhydroxybutyrate depolymerase